MGTGSQGLDARTVSPTSILLVLGVLGVWEEGTHSERSVDQRFLVGKACSGKVSWVSGILLIDGRDRLGMDLVRSLLGDLNILLGQKTMLSNVLWPLQSLLTFGNHLTDHSPL